MQPKPFIVRRPFALAPGWHSYRQRDGSWGADYSSPKRFDSAAAALSVCTPQNEGVPALFLDCMLDEYRRLTGAIAAVEAQADGTLSLGDSMERTSYRERLALVESLLCAEAPPRYRSAAEAARNEGGGQPEDGQTAQECQP